MADYKILWADDEVDMLKPLVIFLERKGFEVHTVTNGLDALDKVEKYNYDVIFLDENMPGLSGLETLSRIKEKKSDVPIVMITKSEEEHLMEDAIGSKIADYLIKPVNPNQILLSVKKLLDNKRLISEKTTMNYQQEFRSIAMAFMDKMDFNEWKNIYKKLVFWELELEKSKESTMYEVFENQKKEANHNFADFIKKNYLVFVQGKNPKAPLMSKDLLRKKVFPHVSDNTPVVFLLIDNLRYDQWKIIRPLLSDHYDIEEEDIYLSILPTTTQYCRNAIFSGMMPLDIEKKFPKLWSNDEDEGGKNMHEETFLTEHVKYALRNKKFNYSKITNLEGGKTLAEQITNLLQSDLTVIVYNFVDALSHARTDVSLVRELSDDEAAYRSVTRSWFEHSPLLEALKKAAEKKIKLIISTDHGSVKVKDPIKIIGDKNTNTNLRYKQGKNLNYNSKEVFEIKNPEAALLPKLHISSGFVFADEQKFFAYPNNYNYYVNYYKDTIQHGGISLEEMMIPVITLKSK